MGASPQQRRTPEELEVLLRYKKLDIWADVVHLAIPWGSLVIIAVLMYFGISRLAGQVTLAQIGLGVIADIRLSDAVSYVFGGTALAYGLGERRLRHKKTERLASHAQELEKIIHPTRTSSGLTPKGTTRPEDKR